MPAPNGDHREIPAPAAGSSAVPNESSAAAAGSQAVSKIAAAAAGSPAPTKPEVKPAAPAPTIFKVLRSDEVARRFLDTYEPKEVFLGLYYVSPSTRSRLEPIKKFCSGWLFKKYGAGESATKDCLAKLKAEMKPTVDCYELSESPVVNSDDDKAEWLFQDACFVIAVVGLQISKSLATTAGAIAEKDPWGDLETAIANSTLSWEQVKSDLTKLRNQIPMSVLQTVLDHAKVPDINATLWFTHWTQIQFHDSPPTAPATPLYRNTQYHLVHYLHSAYAAPHGQPTGAAGLVASSPPPPPTGEQNLPSAEELHRAGIRFAKPTAAFTSLLEIRLTDGGKLKIPPINASPHWMVLLQSLVDFEQSMIKNSSPAAVAPVFSAYVKLLAGLLRTPRDVQLLRDGGVGVTHNLNSDQDLVDFLRCLSAQVTRFPSTPRLNKLLTDVARLPRPRPSSGRTWMTNYLPSNWKPLAALLIIAAIGTYTSARTRARKNVQKPQKSTVVIPNVLP